MSNIRLELPENVVVCTGKQITFSAPCDCTSADHLLVNGHEYTIVDAIGRPIAGQNNVWVRGAMISVILNCEDEKAYIQNGAIYEHDHSVATQEADGFQSAADKKKLDGIEAGANKITVDSELSDSSTNPVQNKVIKNKLDTHTHDYLPLAGGTMQGSVTTRGIILTEGLDYGDTLPTGGVKGQLFFKKVV